MFTIQVYFTIICVSRHIWRLVEDSVRYNKVQGKGNILENQFEVYPNSTIVECYFHGSGSYAGLEGASFRMVFEKHDGEWYLVGIIHNQWTI